MTEFFVLSAGLLALLVLLTRRGADRLTARWVPLAFMGYGALLGILLEALPFSAVRGRFSLRTVVAAFAGVFVMRLISRGVVAWAGGYRDEDRGAQRRHARLLHPLMAVGLAISGVLVMHESVVSRHLALEVQNTPRDRATGVVRGAEPIELPAPDADEGVLLLHGFLSSPADFGDLPSALADAGIAVSVPLLPGHGTTPRGLTGHPMEKRLAAALAAFDALAAAHEQVSVVGFSMGGLLAAQVAGVRDVHRLVLVNPFVGETAAPEWSPFDTDDLIEFGAPLIDAVIRSETFMNMNDRTALSRLRAYRTVPLAAVLELREYALRAREDGVYSNLPCPTLLLLSTSDHVTPAADTHHVLEALATREGAPPFEETHYAKSDHVLLLDFDRAAAAERIVEWLAR